jgi:hypothetical protein
VGYIASMSVIIVALVAAVAIGPDGNTSVQRADLACLGASKELAQGRQPLDPMARYYLHRLQVTDAKRDWLSEASIDGQQTYRDFMAFMNECQANMMRSKRHGR